MRPAKATMKRTESAALTFVLSMLGYFLFETYQTHAANNYTVHDSSPVGSNYPTVFKSVEVNKVHLPQQEIAPTSIASSDTVTSTANAAAVITIAAQGAGVSNVVSSIALSYSATPTGATLKVEDGSGHTVWGPHYITAGGLNTVTFNPSIILSANTATIITATAAGGAITETLSVIHKSE